MIGLEKLAQEAFDFSDLPLRFFPAFVGLAEDEDILVTVVAIECFENAFEWCLATRVSKHGEVEWIALSFDDGFNDAASTQAVDVADDVIKLDIHGFLHMLDLACAVSNEVFALAVEIAHASNANVSHKGGVEEACGVELLKPLSILDIGLATRNAFDVTGVDETDVNVGRLEEVVEWDPVVASALHGNGLDAGCHEPDKMA